ncbi:MAG: arsenate reductase ArsC, partial [Acetobacteraceae bacterium]|nr:arsenate reductase ArsC [Acetobacteraceae bacterium]
GLTRLIEDAFRTGDPMTTPPAFTVLFLCTRNSARSIMGEAILNAVGKGRFRGVSAGSAPSPEGPLPAVLSQLKALGHDVAGLRSKSWEAFTGPDAPPIDFVIALCDTLNGQACPEFGETTITAAWPLPDPAKFSGTAAEQATLLNELYAGLRRRIEIFISLPFGTLDRMALKARVEALADPHALAGAR